MAKNRLRTTKLARPIPLGCGHYHVHTMKCGKPIRAVKCAQPAIYRLERNGDEVMACELHRPRMARSVGRGPIA